ncbi:nucleotide exchange factor GrpE [Desulfotruncus alcoholivorax]|uniref:nucleotide exchange factor GrpE n=1 Tax=Desulfotruncus alcoholivorax TaxID=265477 RepID=UPI001EE5F4AD|nr:nucleotide exchange factor GrpE [Desulfotruncus alcoholivorax]
MPNSEMQQDSCRAKDSNDTSGQQEKGLSAEDAEEQLNGQKLNSVQQQEEGSPAGAAGEQLDVEQLRKELAEQKAKAEEYFNRLVRLQADFDNYRKRTQREKEEYIKYASASLCEQLLPVIDNFHLALAAKDEDPSNVVKGVEMIYRQLEEILQREGLTPVEAVGQQFDPAKHEAVMQEETREHPENTVIAELRRGYYLKDRLLRPAMVKVAKPC